MLSNAQNTAPATTQEQAMPGQREERGGRLAGLNLSDEQRAQIKQIHEGARSRVDAIKNDASLSAEQKETKIHEIHHDTHEQVKKVLTPEQRKQMHEKMRENHDRNEAQQPPSR
jgi:Spy/CpxP family protein refolding chaperone